MKWNKQIVEESKKWFYPDGGILCRESDQYIIDYIKKKEEQTKEMPDKQSLRILDYGCGSGRLLHLLKKNNIDTSQYMGFDTSLDMIEECLNKFKNENILGFTDNIKDIEKDNFDIIICIDVLQHRDPAPDKIQKEIIDISKLGIESIFHFWYKDNDDFQKVGIMDQVFSEYFPSPVTITNKIVPDWIIGGHLLKFFNGSPYKCSVLHIYPHIKSSEIMPIENLKVIDTKKSKDKK